jgi:hypothetical protein
MAVPIHARVGWIEGKMRDWDSHMHAWNATKVTFALDLFGVVCGLVVIVAAVMLHADLRRHLLWGVFILAFSVISVTTWMGSLDQGWGLELLGDTCNPLATEGSETSVRSCSFGTEFLVMRFTTLQYSANTRASKFPFVDFESCLRNVQFESVP